MRGLAVALLASLGACVTGSEPVVEPAQEHVADRAAPIAPEPRVELPPIREILEAFIAEHQASFAAR